MSFLYRALCLCGLLVALLGCGDSGVTPPRGGGTGNASGSGGFSGNGGVAGTGSGGVAGTGSGGDSGSGGNGNGGTGNASGTGGVGATGISIGGGPDFAPVGSACNTNVLCYQCPTNDLCNSDDDCTPDSFCGSTGCTSNDGRMIGRCQGFSTPRCDDDDDCPDPSNHACVDMGFGGVRRCVPTAPGCNPMWESIDCPVGYACEGGSCVDRRVPCDSSLDCPKSHTCRTFTTQRFCVRTYRDCNLDTDCSRYCADVDNDGRTECAGELDGDACVNSDCSSSAPVCENGNFGNDTDAVCGDFGLCLDDGDCRNGFDCVALSGDGRKECVLSGPRDCDSSIDCAFNEVCASGRSGGAPECQRGTAD